MHSLFFAPAASILRRSLAPLLLLLALTLWPQPSAAQEYVVRKGDILGRIAERFGCPLSDLRKANRLRGDHLKLGQRLRLPRTCRKAPPAAKGAAKGAPAKGAPKGRAAKGAQRGPGRTQPVKHTIKRGETLGHLARRYGCTAAEIRRANRLRSDRIQIGKTLTIPVCYTDASGRRHVSMVARVLRTRAAVRPTLDQAQVSAQLAPLRDDLIGGLYAMDHQVLAQAMKARGFYPPPKFRGLVVELLLDDQHSTVARERWFDYQHTAQLTDWNVGSTIKIFAAMAALEFLHKQKFGLQTLATFFDARRGPKEYAVSTLVHDSLSRSDNIAYNRLSQLAGYDAMNGETIQRHLGLEHSGIHRPYEKRNWLPLTGATEFRHSPKILLKEGERAEELAPRVGEGQYACMGHAACSHLVDLARAMRHLMIYEFLPPEERLNIPQAGIDAMRHALSVPKRRGTELADGLRAAFGERAIEVYHKPGFAEDWMSDVAYVVEVGTPRRWIVSLAGFPGRTSIVSAAHTIGYALAHRDLERTWPHMDTEEVLAEAPIPENPPAYEAAEEHGALGGADLEEPEDGEGPDPEEPEDGEGPDPEESEDDPSANPQEAEDDPSADPRESEEGTGAEAQDNEDAETQDNEDAEAQDRDREDAP